LAEATLIDSGFVIANASAARREAIQNANSVNGHWIATTLGPRDDGINQTLPVDALCVTPHR